MSQTAVIRFNRVLRIFYALALLSYSYFLLQGLPFYLTPQAQRVHHEAYRLWRPAGNISHGFGVIGGLMLTLMLLYSVRKRFRLLQRAGHINYWLKVHIFFGILGPLFIILHSTFKVQGLVAVCFWSMIAVAVSGVLGRYLYLQIPRTLLGDELNLQQAQNMDRDFREKLTLVYGLPPTTVPEINKVIDPSLREKAGSLSVLFSLFRNDLLRPFRMRKLSAMISENIELARDRKRELMKQIRQEALLHRRIILWNHIHSLFHYWHVIHQPFAYIMYLTLLVHISVSLWLGYTWIF